MNQPTLAAAQWTFGVNDPSFFAWLIFFIYFVTAFLCWRARPGGLPSKEAAARLLWTLLSLCLILLGLNKQLDLHRLLLDGVRELIAKPDNSRWLLGGILAVVGLLAGSATLFFAKLLLGSGGKLRWAYLTLFGLLGFQVLRFLPGPISGLMVTHLFTEEEGLLHIHFIELLELGCLIVISLLARGRFRLRASSPSRSESLAG